MWLATGQPVLVQDIDQEPQFLFRAVARNQLPPETVAFLALPLVVNNVPVGVLACHRIRSRQRHLNDEPVEACPPSALYRLSKFIRRNKRVLATTVTGLILAAVATVSFGIYYAYAANRLGRALAEADHLTASLALREPGL